MDKPCTVCRVIKPLDQFAAKATGLYGTQARCKPCQAAYRKRWYDRNAEAARAASRAYFAANSADMARKNTERVRQRKAADPEYRDRLNAQSLARARVLRLQILVHDSSDPPCCACCGEAHMELLHLDHVNGDGSVQRRQKGSKGTLGTFYWIIRNTFPEGYRVRCANCNLSHGRYGYCPHERERT